MAPVNLFTTIFLGYWIRILCFLRVRSVSGSHAEEIMTSHFLLARQRFMYVQVLYSFSERDYICTKWLKDLFKSTSATAQKGGIGQREGWWRERGQTEIVTPSPSSQAPSDFLFNTRWRTWTWAPGELLKFSFRRSLRFSPGVTCRTKPQRT